MKKNRRNTAKYPALEQKLNLKIRSDLIDYDYLDKLSPEEKRWLNTFTEEYVNANMKHGENVLHKTKRLKKDCTDRNNARNRDILGKSKAKGNLVSLNDINQSKETQLQPDMALLVKEKLTKK